MLIGIAGDLGSGKTLTATYLACKFFLEGKKIYTNYTLKGIPHKRIYSLRELNEIHSGAFIGDELWTWVDSRLSQKLVNKMTSLILAKSRKRDLTIVWTAQLVNTIEKRIRLMTERILFPETLPRNADVPKYVRVQIVDRKLMPIGSFVFPARVYFNFYDTREEVLPPIEMYEDIIGKKLSKETYLKIVNGELDVEALI